MLKRKVWFKGTSILSLILIILVPKCPFCVLAYFGFISTYLISENNMALLQTFKSENVYIFIVSVLCLITILGIYFSKRSNSSKKKSLLFAFFGALFIIISGKLQVVSFLYYIGLILMLIGIFYNKIFILKKIKK